MGNGKLENQFIKMLKSSNYSFIEFNSENGQTEKTGKKHMKNPIVFKKESLYIDIAMARFFLKTNHVW